MTELTVRIIKETKNAALIECNNKQVWLPKRFIVQVGFTPSVEIISIPDWLAKDRGLI